MRRRSDGPAVARDEILRLGGFHRRLRSTGSSRHRPAVVVAPGSVRRPRFQPDAIRGGGSGARMRAVATLLVRMRNTACHREELASTRHQSTNARMVGSAAGWSIHSQLRLRGSTRPPPGAESRRGDGARRRMRRRSPSCLIGSHARREEKVNNSLLYWLIDMCCWS